MSVNWRAWCPSGKWDAGHLAGAVQAQNSSDPGVMLSSVLPPVQVREPFAPAVPQESACPAPTGVGYGSPVSPCQAPSAACSWACGIPGSTRQGKGCWAHRVTLVAKEFSLGARP